MRTPTARAHAALRTAAAAAERALRRALGASPRVPAALHVPCAPKYDASTKLIKRRSLKLTNLESRRGGGAASPPRRLSAAPRPHHVAVGRRGEPVRHLQLAGENHELVDKSFM